MKKIRHSFFRHEKHGHVNWLRDVILGGQDGLVNVLGVVLGVSAASGDSRILIAASLAAAFAESVSMAAVAYTSSLAAKDYYQKELEREKEEIKSKPELEKEEIREIYRQKGFSGDLLEKIVSRITSDPTIWLKTMMREELKLEEVNTPAILRTSMVVGVAALTTSLIPITPFFFLSHNTALLTSLVASGVVLFAIGVYEATTFVGYWLKNGMQMMFIGLGAALIGFLIGKLFQYN